MPKPGQSSKSGAFMRVAFALALIAMCGGCVANESVRFQSKAQQEALVRDGNPALVSRKKNSLVLIRPASRQFASGARPIYVVGIYNLSAGPVEFRVADIEAAQVNNGQSAALKVITYEQLVTEERNHQIMSAMLVGVAAGANAYSASQAGRYSANSTVTTPRGRTYEVRTTGYSPAANAIAQSRAAAQNEVMIGGAIETGQRNMAVLERAVIKDNTLLPGEWYGGQLHLQPLASDAGERKTYSIALMVGNERHEIDVVQEAAQ
jgi:hypothetical protein